MRGTLFCDTNGSSDLRQTTRLSDGQKKKKWENLPKRGFVVSDDYRVKLKESKKRDKYLDLAKEMVNVWNMKVMVIQIVIGRARYSHQMLRIETGGLRNKRTSRDYPNHSIGEISRISEMSPGDSKRLALT